MSAFQYHQLLYPPIPESTAWKAKSFFGGGNIYLIIGDRLNELLTGLIPKERHFLDAHVMETYCLYLLISAIQYREHLTDLRFIDALPRRSDIQYALHLQEEFPGIGPLSLREFRQQMLAYPLDLFSFQVLLDRLAGLGAFCGEPQTRIDAAEVVNTLMIGGCLEKVVDAFCSTLERFAAEEPDWLDRIAPPHWRERYNREALGKVWPNRDEDSWPLAVEIGKDVCCLMDAVRNYPGGKAAQFQELVNLENSWKTLTEVMDGR